MSVNFSSQELWYIGIFVFLAFIIFLSIIIIYLSGGLGGLWDNFESWCSDLDWKFKCFCDDLNPITLWYEFLIILKIISLKVYCYFLLFFKLLFIDNPALFLLFVITIIISYSYPTLIIYKLLPVIYLIVLFVFVIFISEEENKKEKKNKKDDDLI